MAHRQQAARIRHARLAAVVAELRDRFGEHIIRTGDPAALPVGVGRAALSSGSLGLDLLVEGLPRGAMVEYAGVDGSGKETLALTALAHCQRAGGLALLLDAEGTTDPDALTAVGIHLDALVLACPITAAEAWGALEALARCGALDLLVTSLSALFSMPGQYSGGFPPRALSRLQLALRGRPTTVLATNIPISSRVRRQTIGGQAVAQAAALRIAFEPGGPIIAPHGDIAGLRTTARVVKYHGLPHGPPVTLEMTAHGPRRAAELFHLGRLTGCLSEQHWGLVADGQFLGRSPGQAMRRLEADPLLAAQLEEEIRAAWTASPRRVAGSAR
ncbi:MAG TPA: hypothetical protein VNL71_09950 [Chloroflexota bacterium]|nr:hypothetical protein [Chloroflexota bacterium]